MLWQIKFLKHNYRNWGRTTIFFASFSRLRTKPSCHGQDPARNQERVTVMATSAILRPPGPKSIPIFGRWNALVKFFRDPILFLNNLHQQYGKIAAFTSNGSSWL